MTRSPPPRRVSPPPATPPAPQVIQAAEDAAIAIVAHLTGETVSADDAAAAVRSATGR